jgi:prepilin-type N-terminal cleavage/methylation domain-containing protein
MKRSEKGFTLIELMIVVAIIAIIAAIAIPSLLRSKMSANHSNAGAALKSIVTHESVWRGQDLDKNTVADYWTGDVAAFHFVQDASGRRVALIDQALGNADYTALGAYPVATAGGGLAYSKAAKQGYYYQALTTDQEALNYQLTTSAATLTPAVAADQLATNVSRFGFSAFPAAYNTDGMLQFVVGEDGTIWQKDCGTATGSTLVSRKAGPPPGTDTGWAQFGQ